MGERRRPEVVHDFGQLPAVVAVHKSGEQRCIPRRQRSAGLLYEPAQRVCDAERRTPAVETVRRADLRGACEMSGPQERAVGRLGRLRVRAQAPALPHRCPFQPPCSRTPCPAFPPVLRTVDRRAERHHQGAGAPAGIADQQHLAFDFASDRHAQRIELRAHRRRCEHQQADRDEDPRTTRKADCSQSTPERNSPPSRPPRHGRRPPRTRSSRNGTCDEPTVGDGAQAPESARCRSWRARRARCARPARRLRRLHATAAGTASMARSRAPARGRRALQRARART